MKIQSILFVIYSLITMCKQKPYYYENLRYDQLEILGQAYIQQYRNKRCIVRAGFSENTCQKYCQLYYDYVPTLPYKNARQLNKNTMQCEPKKLCPRRVGVSFDKKAQKCFDFYQGIFVSFVDAVNPYNRSERMIRVKFICQNGKVQNYNGKPDCKCSLGYTTYLNLSTGHTQQGYELKKCDTEIPLSAYFPNALKIYYDPNKDNPFPFATSSDYWFQVFEHYIRKLKYAITTFFVPWQVQIITILIPKQDNFREKDLIIVIQVGIVIGVICIFSIFEKCIKSYRERNANSNIQL